MAKEWGGVTFSVLNYKRTSPKLNDIYIDTTTAISKWYITNTAPTNPSTGDVYFTLVEDSDIAPNLTDNVQVYLDKCWQWSGSAWVQVEYEWWNGMEWIAGEPLTWYAIENGALQNGCTTNMPYDASYGGYNVIHKSNYTLTLTNTPSFNKIYIEINSSWTGSLGFVFYVSKTNSYTTTTTPISPSGQEIVTVDISGEGNVTLYLCYRSSSTDVMAIQNLWVTNE